MPSTQLEFSSQEEHLAWLRSEATLPRGFRVGTASFEFVPVEVHKPSRMNLTLIALDEPSDAFAAMFTRNAFPGAPVIVGRARLSEPRLGAIVVNNKISNVCAPDGVATAERVCQAAARLLGMSPSEVLPSSTGVIGWQLPANAMIDALPRAFEKLGQGDALTAAQGIMTTDLYPKVRARKVGKGRIVGIAKGAGMIEPNLATMLVYLMTDCELPRESLRAALRDAVEDSFHDMSIDSDTSTSDTIALLSSKRAGPVDEAEFRAALTGLCRDLTEDVVRNGEGVHHVMRVVVRGAPDKAIARGVGKSIVNSPLVQCAVCGNDPNVGRLVMAIGKYMGALGASYDLGRTRVSMGGETLLVDGVFRLDPTREQALVAHLKAAELYASAPPPDGLNFVPPAAFPRHERAVEIEVDLGLGQASATVLGADRSHEYITENADYRS